MMLSELLNSWLDRDPLTSDPKEIKADQGRVFRSVLAAGHPVVYRDIVISASADETYPLPYYSRQLSMDAAGYVLGDLDEATGLRWRTANPASMRPRDAALLDLAEDRTLVKHVLAADVKVVD